MCLVDRVRKKSLMHAMSPFSSCNSKDLTRVSETAERMMFMIEPRVLAAFGSRD